MHLTLGLAIKCFPQGVPIFHLGAWSLPECGSLDPEAERLFARKDILCKVLLCKLF